MIPTDLNAVNNAWIILLDGDLESPILSLYQLMLSQKKKIKEESSTTNYSGRYFLRGSCNNF